MSHPPLVFLGAPLVFLGAFRLISLNLGLPALDFRGHEDGIPQVLDHAFELSIALLDGGKPGLDFLLAHATIIAWGSR